MSFCKTIIRFLSKIRWLRLSRQWKDVESSLRITLSVRSSRVNLGTRDCPAPSAQKLGISNILLSDNVKSSTAFKPLAFKNTSSFLLILSVCILEKYESKLPFKLLNIFPLSSIFFSVVFKIRKEVYWNTLPCIVFKNHIFHSKFV